MTVSTPSIFFFDYYAGTATRGLGIRPLNGAEGIGMYYVYMLSYLSSVIVLLPLLLTKRFGTATAVFFPYVVLGFPINYHFEWTIEHTWKTAWSGLYWSAAFLLTGLSADIAYYFLPQRVKEPWRATFTGAFMSLASFVLTLLALAFVYREGLGKGTGSFLGISYFGLPWMTIHSAFGGFTALCISKYFKNGSKFHQQYKK